MRIALLGSTSQIAKDLILSFHAREQHELTLYARRPDAVARWLDILPVPRHHAVADLAQFEASIPFDAVINFVGVANPAAAVAMGSQILEVTDKVDNMVMTYLERRPNCRYIFLSSGAAYCSKFDAPAEENTCSALAINHLRPQDWYGLAKMYAECRHRARAHLSIIDLRVFSYFSRTQDMSARFLLTDAMRSIRNATVLQTSAAQNLRDYLHPSDFHSLIDCLLMHEPSNTALDCYTRAPIDKWTLLEAMRERFSLRYEIANADAAINATGSKPHYYSLDRRAAAYGYVPSMSSIEGVLLEAQAFLGANFDRERATL